MTSRCRIRFHFTFGVIAAALLLFSSLMSAVMPTTATAQATPSIGECTTPPRTLDELPTLPDSLPQDDWADTEDPIRFKSEPNLPADAATIAGVEQTVSAFYACINSSDPLQLLAFMTDRFISASYDLESLSESWAAPPEQYFQLVSVDYVRIFEDGRAGAVIVESQVGNPGILGTEFMLFADVDGVWLIDGMPSFLPEADPLPADAPTDKPIVNGEILGAADCTLPARTQEEFDALNATHEAAVENRADHEDELPTITGPASADEIAAMTGLARSWIACMGSSNVLQASNLYSERFFASPNFSISLQELETPLKPIDATGYLGIAHPVHYADGRIGAIIVFDSPSPSPVESIFIIASHIGDLWQIDFWGGGLYQDVVSETYVKY